VVQTKGCFAYVDVDYNETKPGALYEIPLSHTQTYNIYINNL
jgi:hypothetical protein